jgi:phage terminase large subunit-like protein
MEGRVDRPTDNLSPVELLVARGITEIPPEMMSDEEVAALQYDWRGFWARPKQLAPADRDWMTWVINAGRGFGKTRTGAGWVQERAEAHPGRWIALIARTPADARDYMIEGPGGILKHAAPTARPQYQPSNRRLIWPNGSWATIYSDEEPDQLRGFSGDTSWSDEFAKFKNPQDTWDNLQFGMREASGPDHPRNLITTTPRPIKVLKAIMADPMTVVTHGSSYENRSNLDPTWFKNTISKYEGTRFGRQEIHAEVLSDVPGALWTLAQLDELRVRDAKELPDMQRVVIGVDPSASEPTDDESLAECGIVAAGLGVDGTAYVLSDGSLRAGPNGWAKRAVSVYDLYDGDRVVAEANNGGAMVESTIRAVRPTCPVTLVHASRGKVTRAEPISALYAQSRVRHVGTFPELEDQMIAMTPFGVEGGRSPDRADALVWALTELFPKMTRKKKRGQDVEVEGLGGYRPHG